MKVSFIKISSVKTFKLRPFKKIKKKFRAASWSERGCRLLVLAGVLNVCSSTGCRARGRVFDRVPAVLTLLALTAEKSPSNEHQSC